MPFRTTLKKAQNLCNYSQRSIQESSKDRELREFYRDHLWDYFQRVWQIVEPETELSTNWHQELICEYLEEVAEGNIKKLLINIAPRHLKSILVNVVFPTWMWVSHPGQRGMYLSYSGSLANDMNDLRRQIIQSDFYQWLCPSLKLSNSKNRITEFENNYLGRMVARGLDATVTGGGGSLLIFDDPNNPEKVESEAIRNSTLKKFRAYSTDRRNDPKNTAIVIIQQRTHQEDVSGYIQDHISGYTHLILPTEEETGTTITFPRSGKQIYRHPGDLLHPDRFGKEEVEEARETLGSYLFEGRHQQRPAPLSGGIIHKDWWRTFSESSKPRFRRIIWTWDTAFKANTWNDYSAGICIGESRHGYYLLDLWHGRVEYPELKKQVQQCQARIKASVILVEDKASGQSIVQELGRNNKLPLEPCKVDNDKVARACAAAPTIESGRVFVPEDAPWVSGLIDECSAFPNGAHCDRVDALSQGINWLNHHQPKGLARSGL